MKLVIFGLTISSSWGNGHATLWRALCRALRDRGHAVTFFERDVPYYAAHRDLRDEAGVTLVLFPDWAAAAPRARRELADADVAIVTSYCADALDATACVRETAGPLRVFYDLDTPVTLARLDAGDAVPYIGPRRLLDFDLVLSFTGGRALDALRRRLGARHVAPLYGSVDPDVHRPSPPVAAYRADLSYLGTYADDRQAMLERLLIEPARRLPAHRFVIAGAQYPDSFPWTPNLYFVRHLPPAEHPAFFSSSRLTLNVTRAAMARMGYCPSGRLFEAAACGVPIVSDWWDGLDTFFAPREEVLIARSADDVAAAVACGDAELAHVARRARERALDEHSAARRAAELERLLERAGSAARDEVPASVAGSPGGAAVAPNAWADGQVPPVPGA